jgi:hypothetical protein
MRKTRGSWAVNMLELARHFAMVVPFGGETNGQVLTDAVIVNVDFKSPQLEPRRLLRSDFRDTLSYSTFKSFEENTSTFRFISTVDRKKGNKLVRRKEGVPISSNKGFV